MLPNLTLSQIARNPSESAKPRFLPQLAIIPSVGIQGQIAYDLSGNFRHAVPGAMPSWLLSGRGYCLDFSAGNRYLEIADNPALDAQKKSIAFWAIMPTGNDTTNANLRMFTSPLSWSYPFTLVTGLGNSGAGTRKFALSRGGAGVHGQITVPMGVWAHYVLTDNGTTIKGYVNGVEVTVSSDATNWGLTDGNISIGRRQNATGYFTGNIGNLLYYTRVLTLMEVMRLYHDDLCWLRRRLFVSFYVRNTYSNIFKYSIFNSQAFNSGVVN